MAYPALMGHRLVICSKISLIIATYIDYPELEAKINQYQSPRRDRNEFAQ